MESIGAEQQKALAPSSRKEGKKLQKTKAFCQVASFLQRLYSYLFALIERCIRGNARLRGALTRILSPKQGGCRPPPKGVPPCSTI